MRPTRYMSLSDLTLCAQKAGCDTVAEYVTMMWEVLEDTYYAFDRQHCSNLTPDLRIERTRRIVKGL